MYHLKTEKPMNNAKRVRTPTLPKLFDDNKSLPLLLQVLVNDRLTPDRSITTRETSTCSTRGSSAATP
jgi:hypothetical protein